jgi:hypothetical protein
MLGQFRTTTTKTLCDPYRRRGATAICIDRQKRLLELLGKLEWDPSFDYKTERGLAFFYRRKARFGSSLAQGSASATATPWAGADRDVQGISVGLA